MHHDRTVLFTVLAHVGQIEALGQREVHLNGGALPLTADAVKKLDVDLGAVEGAIALIDIVGQVEFFHGLDKGVGGQFPGFVRADAALGTRGNLNFIFEAEKIHQILNQMNDADDFGLQLIRPAENVRVILCKLADAEQAMQHTALLMAVHDAQFKVALGQVAVRLH